MDLVKETEVAKHMEIFRDPEQSHERLYPSSIPVSSDLDLQIQSAPQIFHVISSELITDDRW